MRKQFLYLLLLGILCSIGNAWGVDYHYVNTSTWDLTSNFRSALTQDGTARTIDGNSYAKTRKFGSTKSALGNPNDIGTNYIVYEVKTTVTSFDIYVYSTQTSEKKLFVAEVAEGASSATTTELAVAANTGTKLTYAVKGSTNSTIYFFVNDTKILVGDIVAKETGTDLPTGGKVGFSMSFNKGRSAIKSGTAISIEGMEFYLNSNYSALSSTVAPIKTNNTQYVKFTVANPMVLNFTTSSTTKYNVSTSKGTDDNQITPTANVAQSIKLRASGEYYINPQGSNVNITNIAFSAAPTVTYNANGGSGEMDQTYFTIADNSFTAPSNTQVFNGWKDGEGNDYEVGNDVESDVTLYAQWRTPATKHSVEYSLGAATDGTLPTQADVEEGQNFTVAAVPGDLVPPTGKRFKTWNDGSADYAPGAEYTMSTSDVTLTAIYENIYAISEGTHDGGYITINKDIAAETEVVTLTSTPKPGYSFTSWSITKTEDGSSTGISVSDNKFNMPAYAITVNAIFTNTDSRKQILYLTSTSESDTKKDDKLYEALNSVDDYNVIIAAPGLQVPTDYDLVVLHESLDGATYYNHAVVAAAKNGNVPVLNTKSYFYTSARWNWGTPNAGKSEKNATLNTAYSNIEDHPIFAGLTITSNQIEVVGSAADKAMQPIGSFTSGYEGYTLATTSNASSGQGTAIHELTPAQRGVASAKYLMISVSNSKLNDLSTDGQLLFKNAAAYLIDGSASWTPEVSVTIGSTGWATFCSDYALNFAGTGVNAYIVTGHSGSAITKSDPLTNVPANTPLLLNASTAKTYDIPVAASADDVEDNLLVRGTGDGVGYAEGKTRYVLMAKNSTTAEFQLLAENGASATVGTDKAYLEFDGTVSFAPSALRLTDEENNATNINAIDATEEAVKFIENGKLFIKKNGVVYDMLGTVVR